MAEEASQADSVPAQEEFPYTEVLTARKFAKDHEGMIKYAAELGWLTYDGCRWAQDNICEVERLARDTVRGLYAMASKEETTSERLKMVSWAKRQDCRRGIENMLALARSEFGVTCRADIFDRNPWLLNTASGIVDLKTGALSAHSSESYLTRLAPAFYLNSIVCPKWITFLDRCMGGNLELIDYLQRVLGYTLTGSTEEQCVFIHYGSGANGKSTFLEITRAVFGDYAMNASAETFMSRKGSGPRSDLARLRGARFVSASETESGHKMAEAMVKALSGGDTITARPLYKTEIEFKPQFKVHIGTNHKPKIAGTDPAIWRRIRLVPWLVTIPPEERIKDLAETIVKEESSGILAWMIQGAMLWQQYGLADPQPVLSATEDYRAEEDVLGEFLSERTTENPSLRGRGLYSAYVAWCREMGNQQLTSRNFSNSMRDRGFEPGRDHSGRFFDGIGLLPVEQS